MPSGAAPVDRFPLTSRVWIEDHLARIGSSPSDPAAEAAHRELSAFIMERYHEPLCAYVRAARAQDLGTPEDLVASFFAHTLGTPANLQRWQLSRVPLRRWLMTGISLHCRGLRRDRARERARCPSAAGASLAQSHEPTPESAFQRAWARGILRAAAEQVSADLAADGIAVAWTLFERHVIDGIPYAEAVAGLGIPPGKARAVNRRVTNQVARAIETVLAREGVAKDLLAVTIDELRTAASAA